LKLENSSLNKSKKRREQKDIKRNQAYAGLYQRICKDAIGKSIIPVFDLVIDKLKSGEPLDQIIQEIEVAKTELHSILLEPDTEKSSNNNQDDWDNW
jgi:hypothetical protein